MDFAMRDTDPLFTPGEREGPDGLPEGARSPPPVLISREVLVKLFLAR